MPRSLATSKLTLGARWAAPLAVVTCLGACQVFFPFDGYAGDADGGAAPVAPPIADAGPVVVLARGRAHPAEIALDDRFVYWVDFAPDGSVARIPKNGACATCAVAVATHQDNAADVAVDETSVYWITQGLGGIGAVMKADKDGTDAHVVVLAAGIPLPNRIVVDATAVYVTSEVAQPNGAVLKLPKDGSSAPVALARGLQNPGGLAVDQAFVYVSEEGALRDPTAADGAIKRIPKAAPCNAGAVTCPELVVGGLVRPFTLRTDDVNVYFTQRWRDRSAPNAIRRVAKTGGPAATVVATVVDNERVGLAVDGSGFAWTERAPQGGVYVASKDGASRSLLAGPEATPQGIAIDPSSVYFSTFEGGEIVRHAR